jgi:hypothetical protein
MTGPRRERSLVRPHVVTGGRAHPTRNTFDVVTVVIAAREDTAHLSLPISVTKVLLSDLFDSGHIVTHAVVPRDSRPDIKLLKDVLDGLRARL